MEQAAASLPADAFRRSLLGIALTTIRTSALYAQEQPWIAQYGASVVDLVNASSVVAPGATLDAQVRDRDPADADGFLLSGGIAFTVCP